MSERAYGSWSGHTVIPCRSVERHTAAPEAYKITVDTESEGFKVAMIQGAEGSAPAEFRNASDDTVELVLSDEQSRALSQAAECAPSLPRTPWHPDLAAIQTDDLTVRRTARIDRAGNIT